MIRIRDFEAKDESIQDETCVYSGVTPEGQDIENKRSKRRRLKRGAAGKRERFGPISMCDCESKIAEQGGPNMQALVIQSLKNKKPRSGHGGQQEK